MNSRARVVVVLGAIAVVAGCAVTQPVDTPPAVPASAPALIEPSPAAVLEASARARAERFTREGNLADALVQWQLLALLNPDNEEYGNAIARTRREIRKKAEHFLALAEQARKRGMIRQATEDYLRVLNVDRHNAHAAQALREIEKERTRRAYLNRPPRMSMPE